MFGQQTVIISLVAVRPKGVMQELAHKHSRFVFVCLLFVCLQVCHQPHEFQSIILSLFPLRTDGEHPFI
jgi:hypothetical protein